jgi:SAM-dependent methyltransferase
MILLQVIRASRGAPRGDPAAWDRYWAGVTATGDGGDVLWDASSSDEPDRYINLLVAHAADPDLPVIDIGCGNGRFTRALAARFPRAVGTDLSAHAVARARAESAGTPRCEFRVEDMTAPDSGRRLADELGNTNALIRGVLHVLDAQHQHQLAAAIADLLGTRGTLLIAETNHPGPLLGYLQRLGARPSGLPPALQRALAAGLPRPAHFGPTELDRCFPAHRWARLHTDTSSTISTVPGSPEHRITPVRGYLAVLRRNA